MFDEFDEFDVFERALALTKPKGSERNCFVNKNHNPHGFAKPFTSFHKSIGFFIWEPNRSAMQGAFL